MPTTSRKEGEAGHGGSWRSGESWKDDGTGTGGCVQIAELTSLQGTEQRSVCLG